jgi:hypothetical protein
MDEPALCRALASEPLLEFLGLLGLLQICGCRKNALPPEARQYLLLKLGYWDLAPAPRGEPAHWIRQLVEYLAERLRKAANSHAPPELLHSSRFVPFPVELDVVLQELLHSSRFVLFPVELHVVGSFTTAHNRSSFSVFIFNCIESDCWCKSVFLDSISNFTIHIHYYSLSFACLVATIILVAACLCASSLVHRLCLAYLYLRGICLYCMYVEDCRSGRQTPRRARRQVFSVYIVVLFGNENHLKGYR